MDKLLTFDGGQPFGLDDVTFINDIYRSAIHAIANGLTKEDCIITGCEKEFDQNNNLIVHDGFVYIDGEIYYHPEEVILGYDTSKQYVFTPQIVEESERIFKDGTSHYVWEKRTAKIQEGTSGLSINAKNMLEIVRPQWGDWADLSLNSPWVSVTGAKYRKSNNSQVEFKIHIRSNSSTEHLQTVIGNVDFFTDRSYLSAILFNPYTYERRTLYAILEDNSLSIDPIYSSDRSIKNYDNVIIFGVVNL